MRYGEDNYENNFLDDFSGYGGYGGLPATTYTPPVTTYTPPAATYTAPMAQPMGGLGNAFRDDDYTGRMGPDGEPERYSTMLGGDPRIKQQQELAERERRLKEPFSIDNWLKSGNKDVRGTTAASQITLNPGTQYRIRDYSGDNDGQIIASGSTPEEFLMMQDIARGLARQGTNADYRLEQVGGEAAQNFGQYRDPATGEVVSLLGGDLYNKPIAGDIIKIALPLALNVIPGLGLGAALGGKLGLSGLAAKAAGVGLTSALGRTGAGILTGDPVLDSLKAGAITGLASGATAGLLGATGVDKAISGALGSAKGALTGETVGQGINEAAKRLAEEGLITVVGSKFAPIALSGISSASGSLLGNIGKSIDPFQQALDKARLYNELGLGDTVVTGLRGSTTASPLTGALSGASDAIKYIVDPSEVAGQTAETRIDEKPADKEIVVTNNALPKAGLDTVLTTGAGGALNLGTPPIDISLPGGDGELIDVAGNRIRPTRLPDEITTSLLSELPGTKPTVYDPNQIVVTGQREVPATKDPTDLLASVADAFVPAKVSGVEGKSLEQEQAEKSGKKGMSTFGKITGGLAILDALGNLLGGGGGGGGTGVGGATGLDALAPTFRAQLPTPRGQFTPQALGQRPPGEAGRPDIDYARYGYGPARSFFNYVPETQAERDAFAATAAAPAAPRVGVGTVMPQALPGAAAAPTGATDTVLRAGFEKLRAAVPGASDAELVAFLGTPEGQQELAMIFEGLGATTRAKGGSMGGKGQSRESFAVNGAGTGRSDEIPALLSDGEYVIDAETVALLGDGSGKAGAQRLDEFRAKIRKHKGRNLAKGKFSVNAKRPERYLSGGLV